MKIRLQFLVVVCVVACASAAAAQPGTPFIEGRAGAMIPVGTFHKAQNPGAAYTVAGGVEVAEFFDVLLEFTHSFNDADTFRIAGPDLLVTSDEMHQTFMLTTGGRFNLLPSGEPFRPYATVQIGWYHFLNSNDVKVNGSTLVSDDDQDAFGFQAGLGAQGTILEIFERRGDDNPLLAVTLGVQATYNQAVLANRPDRQFVVAMASLGVRF